MTALSDENSIGVFDLKTNLSSVLEQVLAGAIVTVTRHGHPIARITPLAGESMAERQSAAERMKSARKGRSLGMSMKDAIAQGRT